MGAWHPVGCIQYEYDPLLALHCRRDGISVVPARGLQLKRHDFAPDTMVSCPVSFNPRSHKDQVSCRQQNSNTSTELHLHPHLSNVDH
jgi:hypothetical protein